MVSDSPYESGELALPAWAGLVLGAGVGLGLPLTMGGSTDGVGLAAGALACGFWGWVYALCQHRTSPLGFLLVGLSFGVLLWIFSHPVVGLHLTRAWPLAENGGNSIKRCLLFGEALAIGSLLVSTYRGNVSRALPKD